ncbi:copper transporter [Actinorugispora endophytica]|uniref:Copper transport outer membrane protein MctB n=1 Tax=Actinorugispora endophytica TaxID=1605990 RepID=A0A4R6UKN1_9ACTN|nr:copper transporter [Actinorugispora endophytica]TDQ47548.1 copper transport outer membrane protein MctB [Actinorugispora endophytica]
MIDFRYHLVSIVAVFLALTVGIVLGTTMLQDPLLNALKTETAQLREQSEQLRTEKDLAEKLNAGDAQLIAAYADAMLDGRLNGLRVVVVESPGVDAASRDAVLDGIRRAGGTVGGRLLLTDRYLDPSESSFVDEVTDQLGAGLDLPQGNPYERAGAEIAQAVLAVDEDAPQGVARRAGDDFDGEAVLAGFTEAGLLTTQGRPASGADAALVLAPAEPFASADSQEGEAVTPPGNAVVLALARAFEQAGSGTVLAGSPAADGRTGVVRQARAEEARFSTVDTVDTQAGAVVAVLVLAMTEEGRDGHYGIGAGVDGFLPDPLPAVSEPSPEASPETSPSSRDDS